MSRRPQGRMFAPYMAHASDLGAVTSEQNVVVLVVFSEPVTSLTAAAFTVTGPASGAQVSGVKLLRGTSTYYHAAVSLPPSYYGQVQVSLAVRPCLHDLLPVLTARPTTAKHSQAEALPSRSSAWC